MTKTTKSTKTNAGAMSRYGRVGTAAELYKRVIAEFACSNVEAWSAVASTLGLKAAGAAWYPCWYRNQMRRAAAGR